MINKVRLSRKFNCKKKLNYISHILLIIRTQLIYESLVILMTCIINFDLHFHISNVYTAEFWTSEVVATSNFALAISALLIIPYTIYI